MEPSDEPVTTGPRRLVVMRHAKAEPYAASDHERRLTHRGRESALDSGRHLRATGCLPEVALVSSAARTRETWAAVAEGSGVDPAVASFRDELFAGGPDVLLEAVHEVGREVGDDVGTVLLVGHNPTVAFLGHLLDDGNGDPTAVSGMLRGFPPGALVVLQVEAPWTEVGAESGRVVDFHVGGA